MKKPKIACIGEGLIALVPEQGGPLEDSERFDRRVGGAELNVAMAARSLGVESAWLSRIGNDGFGRHILHSARGRGVDVSAVEIDPSRSTGIYVKERGGSSGTEHDLGAGASRMHYYRSGSAASALSTRYLERDDTRAALSSSTIIHTSGITLALSHDSARLVARLPTASRALMSVDANWRASLWKGREPRGIALTQRMLRRSDIAFIGASEAELLFGTTNPAKLRTAIPGPRWLIIKNDGNAAVGFDGVTRHDVAALTVDVVEPIGAGDAFAAGVLTGLARDKELPECLLDGHAAAARALTTRGDHL